MTNKHIYINQKIPYEELKNFIDPIKMTIPIPVIDLPYISSSQGNHVRYMNSIMDVYENLMKTLPTIYSKANIYNLQEIECISYTPHEDGYDFRFNPIDIYNKFFNFLEFESRIPFIDLDKENGISLLKDKIKSEIESLKEKTTDEYKINALDELYSAIDTICKAYNYNLESYLIKRCYILPKDALFYLSYASLKLYKKTKQDVYKIMPYEYYNYVSDMKTSEYPHMIKINNSSKVWFDDFREEYETYITKKYFPKFNEYALNPNQIICAWEILKPGHEEKEINYFVEVVHRNSSGLNEKYRRLYEMKVEYFKNSKYKTLIKGRYGLDGYLGFLYDNDYIIHDKFYNSENVPDYKKTILSHPEAIYSLPSDRITITELNKQAIKEIMAKDSRIIKTNHTLNGSFIGKLDAIRCGPNVSTISFEEVIDKEEKEGKILILK